MLELSKISKAYDGKSVLCDISLKVQANEVVAILGVSGAGKSTIINCINGLTQPDSGLVDIDGHTTKTREGRRSIRKQCATVFQNFNLYPHLTNEENITLAPVNVLKTSVADAKNEAQRLLASVGLADKAALYPAQLSGGQKQRIGICRALAMRPRYLLLDEVTSSLDPEMTSEVVDVLSALAETGIGMILVTHEINVVRNIASRVVFLDQGEIVADTSKDDFFSAEFLEKNTRISRFVRSSSGS